MLLSVDLVRQPEDIRDTDNSTVVEILSAALQSGLFLKALDGKDEEGKIRPYHLGHFFIAIDTEAFMVQRHSRKHAVIS